MNFLKIDFFRMHLLSFFSRQIPKKKYLLFAYILFLLLHRFRPFFFGNFQYIRFLC